MGDCWGTASRCQTRELIVAQCTHKPKLDGYSKEELEEPLVAHATAKELKSQSGVWQGVPGVQAAQKRVVGGRFVSCKCEDSISSKTHYLLVDLFFAITPPAEAGTRCGDSCR